MLKSLKEIAEDLGVSKQRVYRYCIKNHITDAHRDAGVMMYDDTAQNLIYSHFNKSDHISDAHHDAHQNHITDAVSNTLKILQEQLQEKDKQIERLHLELSAEREHARQQADQIALLAENAQQLQKGQLVHQITDGSEKKKHWWNRNK